MSMRSHVFTKNNVVPAFKVVMDTIYIRQELIPSVKEKKVKSFHLKFSVPSSLSKWVQKKEMFFYCARLKTKLCGCCM